MTHTKSILLIISGGIAAYKSLEVIRRLRDSGMAVRCVLTAAGAEFVTPLSVSALSEHKVYRELFSLTDEAEMGHIRLSREADLVVVAPATADLMAKAANGLANDLASTILLATNKPVLMAPTMNVEMWRHPATQRNAAVLKADGIRFVGPDSGDLACGEVGAGRMAEPADIVQAIQFLLSDAPAQNHQSGALQGLRALVTAGPTHEAIDPVRYLANRSSGKQGFAIAEALRAEGAETLLVSGPTQLPDPEGISVVHVESARDMLQAVCQLLPVDIAVCAAAVADWRVADAGNQKIKKEAGGGPPALQLVENPDILETVSKKQKDRPRLVIGFAAETQNITAHALAKRKRKGCDWLLANDVSEGTGIMGGDHNVVQFIQGEQVDTWPSLAKTAVAARLVNEISAHFNATAHV